MQPEELRSLDAWIAEHVFEFQRHKAPDGEVELVEPRLVEYMAKRFEMKPTSDPITLKMDYPKYSTDSAPAMEVLKKCAEKTVVSFKKLPDGQWFFWSMPEIDGAEIQIHAETMELGAALFAKQLFESPQQNTNQ